MILILQESYNFDGSPLGGNTCKYFLFFYHFQDFLFIIQIKFKVNLTVLDVFVNIQKYEQKIWYAKSRTL